MTPQLLQEFQKAPPRRVVWWGMVIVAAWLLLFIGDWYGRMIYFNWWKQIVKVPPKTAVENPRHNRWETRPEGAPGDLLALLGIPWLKPLYFENRIFDPIYMDGNGFYNPEHFNPATAGITVVGDSFMVSLGNQVFAKVLWDELEIPVYNQARRGRGVFLPLAEYLQTDHYRNSARIVIWGISSRELGGPYFLRQPIARWFSPKAHPGPALNDAEMRSKPPKIQWENLRSHILAKRWPSTSILARRARTWTGWGRYYLLREWPRDVLGAVDPEYGNMLFYMETLKIFERFEPEDEIPSIVKQVTRIAELMERDEKTLVVLLVPEREQLYRTAIPREYQPRLDKMVTLQHELAASLNENGVPAIDLLPVLQSRVQSGERLHWRDDTHWNDAGLSVAVKAVAPVVTSLWGTK